MQLALEKRFARPLPQSFAAAGPQALALLAFLVVALATRSMYFGDPAPGSDEQFYLLVADRMWHGALPYVDIWDRKPLGLFLIYAALRPLSSDGILAYQIAALLFAIATASVITRLATRFVAFPAAVAGGCLYLVYLPILGGGAGQGPVFYNLFMAGAALCIVKAGETDVRRTVRYLGLAAMLLVGLSLQVKPTAVFEGALFGVWLIARRWQRDGFSRGLPIHVMAWVAAAALPTALVVSFYVLTGHGDAFYDATIRTVLMKQEPISELYILRQTAWVSTPLLVFAAIGAARLIWCGTTGPRRFLLLWTVAAVVGFFSIGHYYNHYALPALVPLSILCATLMESALAFGGILFLAMMWNTLTTGLLIADFKPRHIQQSEALAALLAPYAKAGCIYLSSGPPVVYQKTGSCFASRYVFPEHLALASEAKATGGTATMAALLATRPSAIVVGDAEYQHIYVRPRNAANDALLNAALAKNYHLKALMPDPNLDGHLKVFVRNDLP